MADINKFTTKEVLNKVLLDSSGDAVVGFSHTTQEALNAVLDTSNNRLNISIAGGTISGDVTISGDLTVSGDSVANVSETITGSMEVTGTAASFFGFTSSLTNTTRAALEIKHTTDGNMVDGFGGSINFNIKDATSSEATIAKISGIRDGGDNQGALTFNTAASGGTVTERMRIDVLGNVKSSNAGGWYLYNGAPSSTVPAFAFVDDTNTGMGQDGADNLTFISGGSKKLQLDANSRISLSNNTSFDGGTSNTVFGKNAGNDLDTGGDRNVLIGEESGTNITTSDDNTAIGYNAMHGNDSTATTGTGRNTAIGSSSLAAITTGQQNVTIGTSSGAVITNTSNTVLIGHNAGTAINSSDANGTVAIGSLAGSSITTGLNTIVGNQAFQNGTTGTFNVAIGNLALASATAESNNVAIGESAMASVDDTSTEKNIAIGRLALTGGSGTLLSNIAIGHKAMDSTGAENQEGTIAIGSSALTALTSGASNTAIGHEAGKAMATGGANTFIGYQSANTGVVTGGENTGLGVTSLQALTSGGQNTALGVRAGLVLTQGSSNVFVGKDAGDSATVINEAVLIGHNAGHTISTSTNVDGTIGIGAECLASLTTGAGNTAIGYEAGKEIDDGNGNTILGYQAGLVHAGGQYNVVIGWKAMDDTDAGGNSENSNNNVAIGANSMGGTWANATTEFNVAIGTNSMAGALEGSVENVAVGTASLQSLTTGDNNVAVGASALLANTTGSDNVVLGYNAMYRADQNAGGTSNMVVIGSGACSGTWTNYTSSNQVVIGKDAMNGALNGTANNVVIGYAAGQTLTTGQNNTLIGASVDVDDASRAGCIIIGKGLSLNTASDNVVEIGNDTNSMTYDLDGGDITVTSDVRTKKNIKETKIGLEFINKLRPITYQTKSSSEYPKEFKVENPSKKSSGKTWDGLIAQEVKEVMDEMNVGFSGWEEGINTKQRLAYGKFVMPLIKAVQELSAKVEELEAKLSK